LILRQLELRAKCLHTITYKQHTGYVYICVCVCVLPPVAQRYPETDTELKTSDRLR